MGLITKPADYTGTVVTVAQLNTLKNTIYDAFGTTANGQGSIADANVASDADIAASKVADNAVVCSNTINAGTQTVTRPTSFSGSLLMTLGTFTTGVEPDMTGVGRARLTYASATTIEGLAGGIEGQIVILLPTNGNVTLGNDHVSATAGTEIFTNTGADKVLSANRAYLLIYDNSAWHEV